MKVDYPITLGVAIAAAAATVGRPEALLGCSEAIRHGELWRLASGSLVHSSIAQLARDLIGFLILGAAYERELGRGYVRLLAIGLVVPAAAVALITPELDPYYGLSGVVYALLGHAIVREWRPRPPRWVVGLAVGAVAKLVFEAVTGRLLWPVDLGDGVVPATVAHLAGAAAGALAAPMRMGVTAAVTRLSLAPGGDGEGQSGRERGGGARAPRARLDGRPLHHPRAARARRDGGGLLRP